MSIRLLWLDNRQIKALRSQLQYVASADLVGVLDEFIKSSNDGEYLCNLLPNHLMVELEQIDDCCHVLGVVK